MKKYLIFDKNTNRICGQIKTNDDTLVIPDNAILSDLDYAEAREKFEVKIDKQSLKPILVKKRIS